MGRNNHFSFTRVTTDELYIWLKDKLNRGYFPKFKNLNDKGIMELAILCKPFISLKLDVAEKLAIVQLEERRIKTEKTTLESNRSPLKTSRDISKA